MSVKEGQIWISPKNVAFVITKVNKLSCYCITYNGVQTTRFFDDFVGNYYKFVGEYANWRNAVVSKQFKTLGENNVVQR